MCTVRLSGGYQHAKPDGCGLKAFEKQQTLQCLPTWPMYQVVMAVITKQQTLQCLLALKMYHVLHAMIIKQSQMFEVNRLTEFSKLKSVTQLDQNLLTNQEKNEN